MWKQYVEHNLVCLKPQLCPISNIWRITYNEFCVKISLVDRSLRFFSSTKSNNLNKQMAPQLFVVEFRDFSGAVDMFWELLDPLVFCTIYNFYADTAPAFQKLQKAQRAWDLRTSAHQARIKLSTNCEQMSPICETVKLLLLSNFHFQTSWQCFPQNQL